MATDLGARVEPDDVAPCHQGMEGRELLAGASAAWALGGLALCIGHPAALGGPLIPNDTYYNSTEMKWYYYTGTQWSSSSDATSDIVAAYAPRYRGCFCGAHATLYHPGDWWLVYDTDDLPIKRGCWYSDAGVPTGISMESEDEGYTADVTLLAKLSACMADIAWAESQGGNGDTGDYGISTYFQSLAASEAFVDSLTAQSAFIQGLFSEDIEVQVGALSNPGTTPTGP